MAIRWLSQIAACLLVFYPLQSAQATERLIPAKDLQSDAAILQQAYEALHPGLYRYNTKIQMAKKFALLKQRLNKDQRLQDAYLAFSLFTAGLKCGHSYPNFYNQPDDIARIIIKSGKTRVPFEFRWLGHKMVVTRNLSSDPALIPGSEILSINNIPARKILNTLMTVARADGSNDAKRMDLMSVRGLDEIETFDVYFPLLFPAIDEQMTLRVKRYGDKKELRTVVAGVSFTDREAARRTRQTSASTQNDLGWTFDMTRPAVALLTLPTFEAYSTKWNWKAYLQSTFTQLATAKVKALIIDIRGNEGGDDIGWEIARYLVTAPVSAEKYQRLVRYRKIPPALDPYLDTWDMSFKDWGKDATPARNDFYALAAESGADVITPAMPHFTGQVFVLTDATNSSAAFQFAELVHSNKLGTLVGEPTGGNQRGINGGAFFFLRLPNSKIEIDVPLIGRFPTTPRQDAGLQPDVLVKITAHDIATGRDAALEKALRMAAWQIKPSPAGR